MEGPTKAAGVRGRPSAGAAVWSLGVTQIVGYGTLYYSFSILAPAMARDIGWSAEWIYGVFSLALLASGLVAPTVGQAFDRFGAGRVMAAGSALAAAALCACALLPGPAAFSAGLIAVELASTLVLYEAAFALLVQLTGREARRSITQLTLIAGFASTLFWPLTSLLHASLSWREVFLVFAALNLGLCLPLHLWLARAGSSRSMGASVAMVGPVLQPEAGSFSTIHQRRALALLTIAFALGGFILSAVLVHLVPLLAALGLGASAVAVGTVFGPAQVLSRMAIMTAGRAIQPLHLAMISSALMPLAILLLAGTAPLLGGAFLFAALFGLGSGLTSIVRGIVPLSLFGSQGYGARLGRMTSARLVLTALGPFAFALTLANYGANVALALLALTGAAGLLALFEIERLRRK